MKELFNAIQVDFNEETETITFSEPDYGMGEMIISMPFIQLEAIYNAAKVLKEGK